MLSRTMGEGGVAVAVQPGFIGSAVRDDVAHPQRPRRRLLIQSIDRHDSSNCRTCQETSSVNDRPARRRAGPAR